MKPGDIFYSPHFTFKDGGQADKLVILLNEPTSCIYYYFILATTQQRGKKRFPGCYPNERGGGYYFFTKEADWFKEDTWVLFDVHQKEKKDILQEHFNKNLEYKGEMKKNNFSAMIKCIKQCDDIEKRILSSLP